MMKLPQKIRDAGYREELGFLSTSELDEEMEAIGLGTELYADLPCNLQSLWDRASQEARRSEAGQRLRARLDIHLLAEQQEVDAQTAAKIYTLAQRIAAAWKQAGAANVWVRPAMLIDQFAYQHCVRALPDVLPADWMDAVDEWQWAHTQAALDGEAAERALFELAMAVARRRFAAAGYQITIVEMED
jgi:hypothetical protein